MVGCAFKLQNASSLKESVRLHIGNRVPYFTTTSRDIRNKLAAEEVYGIKVRSHEHFSDNNVVRSGIMGSFLGVKFRTGSIGRKL